MPHRWRLTSLAIAAVVSLASTSHADSAVITSGTIQLFWDGSTSGIDLRGNGTDLIAEDVQAPPQGLQGGQMVDLGSTVLTSTMTHPVDVTVNGTAYSSVWVRGQFSITATAFTVPHELVGTSTFFTTPIAMTGQFYGFSDQAMTNQVFAASVSGTGIASIGPMTVVAPDIYLLRSGGLVYRFTDSIPSPWTATDVGSVGQPGVSSYDGGTFFVAGSGADIWDTADSFQFVNQALDGDGEIVARVLNVSDTNTFAKAGLMLRSSGGANAADVILDLRPTGDIEFMTRSSTGGLTAYLGGAVRSSPVWLRLRRVGSTVTASVSVDGQAWTSIGSTALPAGPSLVGLAVTSHDNGVLNSSAFDNVAVTASSPAVASDIVVYASDIPAAAVHGAWTAVPDATAAGGVSLATRDNGVSNTSQPLGAPDDYVDVTFSAAPNTAYTLWLRLTAAQNSKWNDSVWVQFSDATVGGTPVYPIDSTSGLLVNLATDSTAASLDGWGWQNGAYWLSQPTTVMFSDSATHTLRIQVREDGVSFDQIVLSPATYATSAPGPVGGDHTIVPRALTFVP